MALFGLATVTIVAMILAVRSKHSVNKALVSVLWFVLALYSFGVRL